jgi:RHS repeat-associated protein
MQSRVKSSFRHPLGSSKPPRIRGGETAGLTRRAPACSSMRRPFITHSCTSGQRTVWKLSVLLVGSVRGLRHSRTLKRRLIQGTHPMQLDQRTLLCQYHYDPLDRLVASTPSAQASVQRFYQKDRLVTEIQGTVHCSIVQYEEQLLAQQQRRNGAMETRLLVTDQQRSVLNVLDANQPSPLSYTAYGHRPADNVLVSPLGFNGESVDRMTGGYLLGSFRVFNPVLMRFNSPDSVRFSPFGAGGFNAYAYCAGDPVNGVDPTGHILPVPDPFKMWRSPLRKSPSLPDLTKAPAAPAQSSLFRGITRTLRESLTKPESSPDTAVPMSPERQLIEKATRVVVTEGSPQPFPSALRFVNGNLAENKNNHISLPEAKIYEQFSNEVTLGVRTNTDAHASAAMNWGGRFLRRGSPTGAAGFIANAAGAIASAPYDHNQLKTGKWLRRAP